MPLIATAVLGAVAIAGAFGLVLVLLNLAVGGGPKLGGLRRKPAKWVGSNGSDAMNFYFQQNDHHHAGHHGAPLGHHGAHGVSGHHG